jgi:phosphoglycerate-specific signal transduction histidine kinase
MPKKITSIHILKQKELLNKIYQILDINEHNSTFILQDIDIDELKQNAIYNLENEIKQNFICGNWSCFKKDKESQDRKWYNIIKYILREFKIEFKTRLINRKGEDNKYISKMQVIINNNNNIETIDNNDNNEIIYNNDSIETIELKKTVDELVEIKFNELLKQHNIK